MPKIQKKLTSKKLNQEIPSEKLHRIKHMIPACNDEDT